MTTRAEKKRRVSAEPSEVKSAAEADGDNSELSPIQKILLIDLMSNDQAVVEQGLTKLADLCYELANNKEANRDTVLKAGGHLGIVAAMRKWRHVRRIQSEGCRSLQNAAMSQSFREATSEVRALEAVLWAIKNYPNDSSVQGLGCGALAGLCCLKQNATHFVNVLKGTPLIIAAMQTFQDNAAVQKWACWALSSLAAREELRKPLIEAGARRALANAIDTHQDESKDFVKDLQKKGREALRYLV